MSAPAIEVRGISKKYRLGEVGVTTLREDLRHLWRSFRGHGATAEPDEFWALQDVSFDVQPGEVVGIVGRNGAGKSTLLKIFSRITEPTSGHARLRGRVASLLEVGTGFHPDLTGRQNVFLNGAILGMRRAEIAARFDEIVAFSEVEKFIDTPVKHYSSGMRVRLAFAVAAHLQPEILIIDEVLAVGDVEFQKKCLGKIGEVASRGRTVLFVSHNLAAVRSLCHSTVLLVNGRVAHQGKPEDTIAQYLRNSAPDTRPGRSELHRNEALGVTLRRVELLDASGRVAPSLETGQPGGLRLVVDCDRNWNRVTATFGINSLLENYRISVLYSPLAGGDLALQPKSNTLTCRLPRVPLMPGRYRLTLKATAGDQTLFYLPDAIEVDVVAGDFFGTGRLPDAAWGGSTLLAQQWEANSGS